MRKRYLTSKWTAPRWLAPESWALRSACQTQVRHYPNLSGRLLGQRPLVKLPVTHRAQRRTPLRGPP